jgi:DNA-binding Lrp family transcriptional regulator
MDTREEILRILKERGAILQKDLWKELKIDSSKCSRILRKLEKEGLIKRVEVVVNGVKTFKIVPAEAEIEEKKEEELSLKEILERMEEITKLPPCFGCLEKDCEAVRCIKLEVWFLRKVMEDQYL